MTDATTGGPLLSPLTAEEWGDDEYAAFDSVAELSCRALYNVPYGTLSVDTKRFRHPPFVAELSAAILLIYFESAS